MEIEEIVADLKGFCEEREIILIPSNCGEMVLVCDKRDSEAPCGGTQIIDDRISHS